jgi:hypothetical protein
MIFEVIVFISLPFSRECLFTDRERRARWPNEPWTCHWYHTTRGCPSKFSWWAFTCRGGASTILALGCKKVGKSIIWSSSLLKSVRCLNSTLPYQPSPNFLYRRAIRIRWQIGVSNPSQNLLRYLYDSPKSCSGEPFEPCNFFFLLLFQILLA